MSVVSVEGGADDDVGRLLNCKNPPHSKGEAEQTPLIHPCCPLP